MFVSKTLYAIEIRMVVGCQIQIDFGLAKKKQCDAFNIFGKRNSREQIYCIVPKH